jgi:hypothetical protein
LDRARQVKLAAVWATGPRATRWELLAYYEKKTPGIGLPGDRKYCLAVRESQREHAGRQTPTVDPRGAHCSFPPALALRIRRHGLDRECGAYGHASGAAVPSSAVVCGLVGAAVDAVSVQRSGGKPLRAHLSPPFDVQLDVSPGELRRAGLKPEDVERLPTSLSVRAFLAVINMPTASTRRSAPVRIAVEKG